MCGQLGYNEVKFMSDERCQIDTGVKLEPEAVSN